MPQHFSQVIRLLKWWVRLNKSHHPDFRFKSFMVELLCAHMLDNGANFKDYPRILQEFFSLIVQSQLKMKVAFTDYYPSSSLPKTGSSPVIIFDPVNAENNVADNYSDHDRITLVEACCRCSGCSNRGPVFRYERAGRKSMEGSSRSFFQGVKNDV